MRKHKARGITRRLAVALAIAVVAGCAATPPPVPMTLEQVLAVRGFQQGEAVDRIHKFVIDGWRYLDPQHVIVEAGPSRNFLLTMISRCNGLSSTEDLGFTTTAGDLTSLDKVVVQSSTAPMERCPIRAIHTLEPLPESGG